MQQLQQRLAHVASEGLLRTLKTNAGIDLVSSDYLDFANDASLKQKIVIELSNLPNGSTGSRLLSGHHNYFEQVEHELAQWVKQEAALVFSSGYQANLALMSALLTENDYVFSDALNHASLIDGMRLTKAKKTIYPHCDLNFLEDSLRQYQNETGLKIIVTESLFSMDGTLADLTALHKLAVKYNAYLIVDEAHATAIWGAGKTTFLTEKYHILATLHCGGKALGVSGAWVAGSKLLKEYLTNFARPFIFSTAPIPALFCSLRKAVKHYQQIGEVRAEKVLQRAAWFRNQINNTSAKLSDGPIVPIVLGETAKSLAYADYLQKKGWAVRAIRPPTVAEGAARLRLTIKWQNTDAELQQFIADFNAFAATEIEQEVVV